jgi:2-amino-4-hydroxy-6-hydroxymethyldihydropteridine diphosphokinase
MPASAMVIVALGSNLGDSRRTLAEAMARLREFSDEPIIQSSLWETTPVNCPPESPKFLNAVVGFVPRKGETPETLLGKFQALEREFGRGPKKLLNEPRLLDVDLIAFGGEMRNSSELVLPHPRAVERKFVLQPLSEIAPGLVLPGQTKTVAELLGALRNHEIVVRFEG